LFSPTGRCLEPQEGSFRGLAFWGQEPLLDGAGFQGIKRGRRKKSSLDETAGGSVLHFMINDTESGQKRKSG